MSILVSIFYLVIPLLVLTPELFAESVIKDSSTSCDVVEILSVALPQKASKKFRYIMSGAGWVVTQESKRYILTPNHVISAGDIHYIKCRQGKWIKAEVIGHSATVDLALLKPDKDKNLMPLFELDKFVIPDYGSNTKIESKLVVQKPVRSFLLTPIILKYAPNDSTPAHYIKIITRTANSYYQYLIPPILRVINSPLHNFKPLDKVILSTMVAIRPGMSGSPIMRDNVPIGMLVKTKNNSSISMAISIEDIIKHLPYLIKGEDSWRAQHPQAPYVQTHRVFHASSQTLSMQRTMKIPGEQISFSEKCYGETFTRASEPQKISNSAKIPGIINISGGDWGDGGDGLLSPKHHTSSGIYSGVPSSSTLQRGIFTSVFKKTQYCQQEGLIDEDNRVLIGISMPSPQPVRKIVTIEELFPIARQHPQNFRSYLQKSGIYLESEELRRDQQSLTPNFYICNPQLLGDKLTVSQRGVDYLTWPGVEIDDKLSWYLDITHHMLPMTTYVEDEYLLIFNGLICQENVINIYNTTIQKSQKDAIDLIFRTHLQLHPHKITGEVHINNCKDTIEQARPTLWNNYIETKHFKLLVKLDSSVERPLYQLIVLDIDPKCIISSEYRSPAKPDALINYGTTVPWLIKIEHTLKKPDFYPF